MVFAIRTIRPNRPATRGGERYARVRRWYARGDRLARYGLHTSWARVPPVRDFVLANTRLADEPVVVISLPRSGSSWVGEILGNAGQALYLHEPLTQSYHRTGTEPTLVLPEQAAPWYGPAAERAFAGLPLFNPWIVRIPEQWRPSVRNGRTPVIKEVNPLLCDWLTSTYRPRVIVLLRHPAAVALSYQRMGWFDLEEFQAGRPEESTWIRHGRRQGQVLADAIAALERNAARYTVVRYEDVCLRPEPAFRDMFAFAGLDWTPSIEGLIRQKTSGGNRQAVFDTARNSRSMADAWRSEIGRRRLDEVLLGYEEATPVPYAA